MIVALNKNPQSPCIWQENNPQAKAQAATKRRATKAAAKKIQKNQVFFFI
jgi:hypothetical protein